MESNIKKKLNRNDICIIIATYNRSEDIYRTLSKIIKYKNIPGKIVIIDQSKDDKTKKVVNNYKKKLDVEYIYCKIPSADISMNIGIKKYKDKFQLLITAGDDVDFLDNYLDEMLKEFNIHPEVIAVGGVDKPLKYDFNKTSNKLSNLMLKLFFLPFKENHKFRIIGPYGNTSSPIVKREIRDAQWIPGFNTCWRSEVYKDYLWPEIRGYNVIDDIDSSYRIYKKYGKGSLVITPKCKVHHRYSEIARYTEKKRIFVNHEDHFSFYYLHFKDIIGTLKLIVSLIGILSGNLLRTIFKPQKENFNALRYNLQGIVYCILNRKNIQKKNYRTFLDDSLNMKNYSNKIDYI